VRSPILLEFFEVDFLVVEIHRWYLNNVSNYYLFVSDEKFSVDAYVNICCRSLPLSYRCHDSRSDATSGFESRNPFFVSFLTMFRCLSWGPMLVHVF